MSASSAAQPARLLTSYLGLAARRLVVVRVSHGAVSFLAAFSAALLVLFAADRLTLLPAPLRALVSAAAIVSGVAFLYARVFVVLLRRPGAAGAARVLEQSYAGFGGFALSAAELALARETSPGAASPAFVEMTVEEALKRAAGVAPREAASAKVLVRPALVGVAAALLWLGAALVFPADASAFLARFTDPLGPATYPTRTQIVSVEAPSVLPKDSPFAARVTVKGVVPPEAVLFVKSKGSREEKVYAAGARGRFQFALDRVSASFSFRVEIGDAVSASRFVTVVERPSVVSMAAEVAYPSYTGVGSVTIPGGNVTALAGSNVRIMAAFNKPVKAAEIEFASGQKVPGKFSPDDRRAADRLAADRRAVFEFATFESRQYRVVLCDEFAFTNPDSAVYSLTAVPDASPVVTLSRPSRDLSVVPDAAIPIDAAAVDDYGLMRLDVLYSVERAGKVVARGAIPLWQPAASALSASVRSASTRSASARSASGALTWQLAPLGLLPGDELTYQVQAADNVPDAPNVAESAPKVARVVTPADKLKELEQLNRSIQAALQNASRRQEESKAALARGDAARGDAARGDAARAALQAEGSR